MKRDLRIVFMGTPEFAVSSLDIIVRSGYDLAAVVTAPDRPAGRGKKLKASAVKDYAIRQGLRIMQPEKLRDKGFIDELKSLKANLFVVVAFRMLPRAVWTMPEFGSFNLHASLLPDYRGAAPINWAIINGEEETGLTTFYLNDHIDTGDIIFQEKYSIGPEETYGELHDRLKEAGSMLVLKTIQSIERDTLQTMPQDHSGVGPKQLHPAPKIQKQDTRINWNDPVERIYNLIRGLSPAPAAYTELKSTEGRSFLVKVSAATFTRQEASGMPGDIETDGKSYLHIFGRDGFIDVKELQIAGKRRMQIEDFLRGFPLGKNWKLST